MVLERHHSRRICLMLLALDTPKLWDRFSLGLESTGLGRLHMSRRRTRIRERVSLSNKLVSTVIPMVPECRIPLHVPVPDFRVQSFKDRSTSLGTDVTRQSLWPHQLPPPLSHLPKGSVTAYITVSAGQEHRQDHTMQNIFYLYRKRCHLSLTCHAAAAPSRSQT